MSAATGPARRVRGLSRPVAVSIATTVFVALVAAVTALNITAVVLDENVYKIAAAKYADGLFGAVWSDSTSRGVARLYSVVITPFFMVFDGDVAVRLARAFNAILFALTALPVFALARRIGATTAFAAGAAALTVAVPWLTLSTILFSESLAYLLFAVTLLAMVRLLEQPGLAREGLVLALLGALIVTRVQFAPVAAAWVLLLVVIEWRAGRRRPWQRFPLTFGLAALGVLAAALRPQTLAGPYYGITERGEVPGNFGIAALWEVQMLAIGVGVVPAILAAAWWPDALKGRAGEGAARLGLVAWPLLAALWLGTIWAQGGFLDWHSEERYFIYTVPLLWIGAMLAVQRAELPARRIGWLGLGLAVVAATVPLQVNATGEQLFLGPVSGVLADALPEMTKAVNDVLGTKGLVSGRDLTAVLVLLLAGGAYAAWTRRRWALVLVPAVVVQVAIGAYAFAGIDGRFGFSGITDGRPFAELGWIDRSGERSARLLDNQTVDRSTLQRDVLFWNNDVDGMARIASLGQPVPDYPLFTVPTTLTEPTSDLELSAALPGDRFVTSTDSPLWQPLDPRVVDRSADGRLQLVSVGDRERLQWFARGLDVDAQITNPVQLLAAGGHRVRLEIVAPESAQPASVDVRMAGRRIRFDSQRSTRTVAELDLCRRTGTARGTIQLRQAADIGGNRFSGGILRTVTVRPC